MPRLFFICTVILFVSCNQAPDSNNELGADEKKRITGMIETYRNAWLKNDSSTILDLFADTATIIPSGMNPIRGKSAIIQFWWPNDSSKTSILSYDINVLETSGSSNMAYILEEGKLCWSYQKGNSKMTTNQRSYEITIFKKADKEWKIIRRLWTDLDVKTINQ
jgi:ketosteroid isomerase-like protein